MIEYVILFLLILSQVFISDIYKMNDKCIDKIIYYFIYTYIVILVGFRYKVGIDTYNYTYNYKYIPTLYNLDLKLIFNHGYQPLFLVFNSIIKTYISESFYAIQFFHAAFINFSIFYFISKYTKFKFTYLLIYLSTFFMYFNFEIMKESTAVAIFLFAYTKYYQEKYFSYFILVLLAILIHQSAAILLFFPLIGKLKFNFNLLVFLLVFLIILNISGNYIYLFEMKESLKDKVINYNENKNNLNYNWMILQLLQMIIIPFILFKMFKNKLAVNFQSIIIFYIIIGIGTLFYQIVFFRFSNYILPFFILYLVYIIEYIYKKRKKNIALIIIICYCFLYNYNFLRNGELVRWYPYESIITEKNVPERDKLFNKINTQW